MIPDLVFHEVVDIRSNLLPLRLVLLFAFGLYGVVNLRAKEEPLNISLRSGDEVVIVVRITS